MTTRLLFPLIFLGLCFCSNSDELKKLDDDDKSLSTLQKGQTAEILGALGDVQFLVHDLGERSLLENSEIDKFDASLFAVQSSEVDRSLQRRQLKDSMDLRKCRVADKGSFETGEFQLQVSGSNCRARMSYFQKRRLLSETSTSRVELMQFRNDFDVRRFVNTEIKEFTMEGEYRNIFEKDDEVSQWKQELEIDIAGKGRHLGSFSYRIEERWLDSKKGDEPRVAISQRMDRFIVSEDFRVTLVRVDRYSEGTLEASDFRLNTEPITEGEYLDIMQDFHNQWSVEALEPR